MLIPVLAIIGVGMIGGSVSLALKSRGLVGRVIGAGRSRASLDKALRLGVIDAIADDPAAAAAGADVILLATPVNASAEIFARIAPAVGEGAVITDVGSVKAGVCAAATALESRINRFVPGHPVAGKEHSGAGAAAADLFEGHSVALTPLERTDPDALAQVRRMWQAIGAQVSVMDADLHDRVLSLTSHLPHVLTYAMVDFFANADSDSGGTDHRRDMAAGGFHDFTRTASSDVEMWRDICLMNRPQILRDIDAFTERLNQIAHLIDASDADALEHLFRAAKETRAGLAEKRKSHA